MGTSLRGAVAFIAAALLGTLLPAVPAARAFDVEQRVPSHEVRLTVDGERVVALPITATHVLLSWPEVDDHERETERDAADGHASGLAVAFSRDGSAFDSQVEVFADHAAEGGDDRAYSGVLWTGGARFVRIVAAAPVADLALTAIHAGVTPTTVRSGPVAATAVDQPQVISRAGWNADESLRFQEVDGAPVETWPPEFYPVQKLIVHHTAGANNDPDPAATVRAIYYYQAIERGWGDIGYNFLIDESGRIYEGRYSRSYEAGETPTGDDGLGNSVVGAHVLGHNAGTIGIALLGNQVARDATPAARAALEWLLAWAAERYAIDPLAGGLYTNPVTGVQKTRPNITGHRDWANTACPGGTFYETLPALRQAVADRIAAGGSPEVPPYTPQPPPTIPQGLTATAHDNFVIKLAWQPSTASVEGPIRYRVFRNGKAIGSLQTELEFTDQRYKANTFEYRVRAIDAAGNRSDLSPPVTARSVKSTGPTIPQGLTATAHDNFVIKLTWQASTSSAAGIIRYRVFRNGKAIGTKQRALAYTDKRHRVNTFRYQVRAIDGAGNRSALSPPITITTVKTATTP